MKNRIKNNRMRNFITRLFLFLFLLLVFIVIYFNFYDLYFYPKPIQQGLYNNNLFYITKNENYDAVFLGSSRVVPFDKWSNQDTIDKILDKKIMNLANQGGGVLNQYTYLSYFFQQDNKADKVIYFIDPFMLHTTQFDHSTMFNKEPFYLSFLISALQTGVEAKTLENYLTSKFTFQPYIEPIGKEKIHTFKINEKTKANRIKYLYPDSLNKEIAEKQKQKILKIISLSKENNSKIEFVILPTLLGKEPGYEYLIAFLEKLKKEHGIVYYDFSGKMYNPEFFRDHDHLNSFGVGFLYRKYISQILL